MAKSHKVKKWKPKENDKEKLKKELTRLTKMVAAEKQSILCRGRKTVNFCAVAAEAQRAPNFLLWIFFEFRHTVGLSLSIPTRSTWPISIWSCTTTPTRNCTVAEKTAKIAAVRQELGIRVWVEFEPDCYLGCFLALLGLEPACQPWGNYFWGFFNY